MRRLDEVDDAGHDRQDGDHHQHDGDDRLGGGPARRTHRTHVFLLDRCTGRSACRGTARSSVMTAERYYGRGMPGGIRNSSQANLALALPAGAQKVPYNVLAEPVGLRAEYPAAVAPGDFVDKCGQALV